MKTRASVARHLKAALLWLGVSIVLWAGVLVGLGLTELGPLPELAASADLEASAIDPAGAESHLVIPDRMRRGDTLSDLLLRNGFTPAEVHEVARALSAVKDVRRLREGDEVEIRYAAGGKVDSISIHHGDLETIELARSEAGWQSEWREVELERRTVTLAGVLVDNLFYSIARLGESAALTVAFANVFSWDFDFHTQSRMGDRFSLVVEKLYRDGAFVGYGDLQAARYLSTLSKERAFDAFLYEDPSGRRDYYDGDGKSLRKAFLRSPVDFDRISSGFSYSRLHPIHNRRMPHLGVDYVARQGTPVYSVAAGVVVDRGFRGGGGNTVTVRHAMGYETKYLHLSGFARGLHPGQRVGQKQVIGYVGSTGTATGAHLDFRLLRHGKPVNPLTQIFPPGPPVAEEFRSEFDARKAELERTLATVERNGALLAVD